MTQRLGVPTVALLTFALAACQHSGSDSTGDASTGNGLGQEAANAAEVARFADEVPFGPSATVARDNTPVRKSPGGSDLVITLPAGYDVVKLAAHGGDDLVCFDEPKTGARHLMGWIAQSALDDSVTPPAPVPTPAAEDAAPPAPEPPAPHGHHHRPHKQPRHQ